MSFLIIGLICISSVSAAEDTTILNDVFEDSKDLTEINEDNELESVEAAEEIISSDEECQTGSTSNVDFTNQAGDEDKNTSFSYLNDLISTDGPTELPWNITFNEKYDGEFIDGIKILKNNSVIDGCNHVVDANGKARIFDISGNNVTIMNFNFLNAFGNRGATIYITGNDTKIVNCTIINGNAGVEAGAVYLYAPRGQIINSRIINCTAKYTGAVLINSVNASVIGSYFENNHANISAGAIGWAAKDNGIIKDCTFVNNAAYNEGGGAIFWNQGDNGLIVNSTFTNNYAIFNGSAIFWSYGDYGLITNCSFTNNNASVSGGAIYLKGKNNIINNSRFVNNSAAEGNAIYFNDKSVVSIENSTFDGKNSIYLSKNSNITLTNIVENKQYDDCYFVLNDGVITLNNNSLTNVVVNRGKVLSKTSIYMLDNATHNVSSPNVQLSAYCIDDNENFIVSDYLSFNINGDVLTVPMGHDKIVIANYTLSIAGVYSVNATLSGNLSNCTYNVGVIVYLKKPQINVSDINITPDENPEISLSIDSDAGGMLFAELNNITYSTSISNGSAFIILPKLASGDYTANLSYSGDDAYMPEKMLISIHIKTVVLDAYDMVRGYNSDYDYQVKLTDGNGNAIENKLMTFTIAKKQYYALTDKDGIAKIKIKLDVSSYEVIISSPIVEETAKTLKIEKRIQNNRNLKVYYDSNDEYNVKIISDDGNAEIKGKSVGVEIDGKRHTYNTDKNGFITIKLDKSFEVGLHTINIQYNGYGVHNRLTVKHTLTSKEIVTVKKSSKKVVLKAKLSKKLKNKIIKFKIKGKTYKVKTNKKGVAKLSINKNKFKKQAYSVKITYLKDSIKTYLVIL